MGTSPPRELTAMPIKIHGMPMQHNYVAIHLACKLAGVEEEFVMCNLMAGDQMKPEYLAKFPMHQAPAMEDTDTGLCITETNSILRYIARKSGSALFPADHKQAAVCDFVLDLKLGAIGHDLATTYIYPKVGFAAPQGDEKDAQIKEKMKTCQWPAIQKFITESGGPFVCGSQVTVADISLWGHVKILSILLPECDMWKECEGMKAWFDAVEATVQEGWFTDDNWGFWKSKIPSA